MVSSNKQLFANGYCTDLYRLSLNAYSGYIQHLIAKQFLRRLNKANAAYGETCMDNQFNPIADFYCERSEYSKHIQ